MLSLRGKLTLHLIQEELDALGVILPREMPEKHKIWGCPGINTLGWLSSVYEETTGKPVPVPTDEQVEEYWQRLENGMKRVSLVEGGEAAAKKAWLRLVDRVLSRQS